MSLKFYFDKKLTPAAGTAVSTNIVKMQWDRDESLFINVSPRALHLLPSINADTMS